MCNLLCSEGSVFHSGFRHKYYLLYLDLDFSIYISYDVDTGLSESSLSLKNVVVSNEI